MPGTLVLVSAASARALTDALLSAVAQAVGAPQAVVLAPRLAAELALRPGARANAAAILASAKAALDGAPVDLAIVGDEHRRKRLLLADMDSTMIEQECVDELGAHVGLRAEIAAITERAMRGEIAFEPALRERVGLLVGLDAGVADELLASRITPAQGARTLVATMRAGGAYCCLVSGGFTLFTGPIAERLGFHEHRANRLVLSGATLAGRVEEPILGRDAKRATLVELRARLDLPREAVLAVGDGANDLAMLQEAGLGVAYRAKPAVAAAAHACIEHGDLTALLYLQGFRQEEFVH